jgi:hypothetical protein
MQLEGCQQKKPIPWKLLGFHKGTRAFYKEAPSLWRGSNALYMHNIYLFIK